MNSNMHIFAGPTLYGLSVDSLTNNYFNVFPPIKRGDIEKLSSENKPGIAVIVDGTFHSYPSVSHMEINEAINIGWKIWGVSSMGAIRAAEMKPFGMNGYGKIYERYVNEDDFSDDEVTMLHDLDYPYTPLSLPMIQIREFIYDLVTRNVIKYDESDEILKSMKNTWYGYRTINNLKNQLLKILSKHDVTEELILIDKFDIKKFDLLSFLMNKPYNEV